MSISRDEALRKIRACMRLAKSSNPHEAAAAMRQAAALMKKYQVDEADVEHAELKIATVKVRLRRYKPAEQDALIIVAIQRLFGVSALVDPIHSAIRFGGDGASAEIAAHAWSNLTGQRRRACVAALRRVRKPSIKRRRAEAFQLGWSLGFVEATAAPEMSDAARLAHDERVRRMSGGSAVPVRYEGDPYAGKSERDLQAGFDAGRAARVQPGVGKSHMALEHRS